MLMKKRPLDLQWHKDHRLDSGASLADRLQWHIEHAEACGCRPIPPSVRREAERRGLTL